MFNLIEELFAPGRRHTDEERERLDITRSEEGTNDPGRGPVNLASGHVLIRPPGQRQQDREGWEGREGVEDRGSRESGRFDESGGQ